MNFLIFLYFQIFVDATRNVNYKGKQSSEEIQRVKVRHNLKANCLTLTTELIFCNLTLQGHASKP